MAVVGLLEHLCSLFTAIRGHTSVLWIQNWVSSGRVEEGEKLISSAEDLEESGKLISSAEDLEENGI